MFFCEYCKIFKNTFFAEHLWTTVSAKFSSPELVNREEFLLNKMLSDKKGYFQALLLISGDFSKN